MKPEPVPEKRSKQRPMDVGNKLMPDATGLGRSSMGTARKLSLLSFLLTLAVSFCAARLLAQTVAKEYRIKAAYLFNFSQYVEWPPEVFKDANEPLTYCTIGDDPFQGMLDESLNAKFAGRRPLRVQHLRPSENFQGCQILFIGTNEKKRTAEVVEALRQSPVLVVGESSHFIQQGGTIGFLSENNTVRFEVNLDAAQRARLNVSATLLSVAETVINTAGGK